MVADVLEVPAKYLGALEASLGEASAFVLATDAAALAAGVSRLRGLAGGRATLVDLSTIAGGTLPAVPEDPGVVGRASDLVRCPDNCRALAERLLGSVIVVEDHAAAAAMAARSEAGLRFVSLDGEVWERGRVRAGSARNLGGLLHRESEIRQLSGQIAELSLAVEGLERERAGLEGRRREALAGRAAAEAELDRRRAALEALARELEAGEREGRWSADEADERRREIAVVEAELETLARGLTEAESALADARRRVEEADGTLAGLEAELSATEAERDAAAA